MSQLKTKYSKEEMAKLGDEIYEKKIRSEVENKYQNKVVAIDIETENYAIGNNVIEASKELAKLCKTNDVWFIRVGHPTLYRIASFDMRREK